MTDCDIPPAEIFRRARGQPALRRGRCRRFCRPCRKPRSDRLMASLEALRRQWTPASRSAPCTWPMIHEMRRGGFTIGSHTESHVSLPKETRGRGRRDRGVEAELERRSASQSSISRIQAASSRRTSSTSSARPDIESAYTACPHGDPRSSRADAWSGCCCGRARRSMPTAILVGGPQLSDHRLWPPARRCERPPMTTHHHAFRT